MTAGPTTRTTGAGRRSSRHPAADAPSAQVRATPPPAPSIEILAARVMRGPSRWSRRPMIRLLVDLGALEQFPSNEIPGFNERLLKVLPGLREHSDAIGRR